MDVRRRTLLKAGVAAAGAAVVGTTLARDASATVDRSDDWGDQAAPQPYDAYDVHRVTGEASGGIETIQAAVNAASPRDLILVEPGRYPEEVEINDTPRLTIRGLDRAGVVIDGERERYNGIRTTVDDTVVENLTVRDTRGNGVYWTNDVRGYRGSYITSIRSGIYGIYAFSSERGRFEHCYASGSKDAGFYIGETRQADAVITDCIAERNAMGYSGTNSGGNLVIRDSIWRDNAVGIVPNTLDSQAGAPQGHENGGVRIENNEIHGNNSLDVPMYTNAYAVSGTGIAIAGGVGNDVVDNDITDHDNYGVVAFPMLTDQGNLYKPTSNAIAQNRVRGSGRADLALAAPATGNSFTGNDVDDTRPALLQHRDGSRGDVWVFLDVLRNFMQADEIGDYPQGRYENIADPDPDTLRADHEKYEMTDPESAPPRPAVGGDTDG